jgi:hypothetical protein
MSQERKIGEAQVGERLVRLHNGEPTGHVVVQRRTRTQLFTDQGLGTRMECWRAKDGRLVGEASANGRWPSRTTVAFETEQHRVAFEREDVMEAVRWADDALRMLRPHEYRALPDWKRAHARELAAAARTFLAALKGE